MGWNFVWNFPGDTPYMPVSFLSSFQLDPWYFNVSNPKFSSATPRWVFCFRLRALFKIVTIEQLLKKIVPWCNMGLPGGVESNFREKISKLFVRLPNRKIKTLPVSWAYSSHLSQFQNTLSQFPKACLAQSNSVTNFKANMGSTKQSWKVNPCFL